MSQWISLLTGNQESQKVKCVGIKMAAIAVHSVAILPEYQGRGLGIVIRKAYTQRMETAGIGDRIALLAHDHLVNFYRKSNYQDRGRSEAKFGGGGWNDMASLPTLDRLRSVVVVRSTC